MTLIADTDALAAFCGRLALSSYITVDTEFMRDRTYYPQLCLVQLAGDETAAAIDALAPGLDLAPLMALMERREILKVFHAGRQDLEIFYLLANRVPSPMFDTQVAAMVCGLANPWATTRSWPSSRVRTSTSPRASPTGRSGRSPSARSSMRSPT